MALYLTLDLAKHQSNKDEHREAFERERRKTEVPRQRHLEDLHVFHDGHRVVPFGSGPVIPELPQESAEQPAQQEIDRSLAVVEQGWAAEPPVDRIEQKDEAEPDRRGHVAREFARDEERKREHEGTDRDGQPSAYGRPGRWGRSGEQGRWRRQRRPAGPHADELRTLEDRRPDRRER